MKRAQGRGFQLCRVYIHQVYNLRPRVLQVVVLLILIINFGISTDQGPGRRLFLVLLRVFFRFSSMTYLPSLRIYFNS